MRTTLAAALIALTLPAYAAIKEEAVTYKDGDTTMKGFIVYDTAKKGKRPGIVLVHEWWGITKHTHTEARRFASRSRAASKRFCTATGLPISDVMRPLASFGLSAVFASPYMSATNAV